MANTVNIKWDDGTTGAKTFPWRIRPQPIAAKPSVTGPLAYTWEPRSPFSILSGYDSAKMDAVGDTTSKTDAGTYTITFTPKANYCWADGTKDPHTVNWVINPVTISDKPTVTGTLKYSGEPQSPFTVISHYVSSMLDATGDTGEKTDAGTYSITFTPKKSHVWADGTQDPHTVSWVIEPFVITDKPTVTGPMRWTGEERSPFEVIGSYADGMFYLSDDYESKIAVDTYTITFTPKENYRWTDGTRDPYSLNWEIIIANGVEIPAVTADLTFNGDVQSPAISAYSASMIKTTDDSVKSAVKEGTYSITFELVDPDSSDWITGGTSPITVTWKIKHLDVTPPSVSGQFTYDGLEHSAAVSSYSEKVIGASGDTGSETKAGTYSITFELLDKDSSSWAGGGTDDIASTWKIDKAEFSPPAVTGSYTFDGKTQWQASVAAFDANVISVSGDTGPKKPAGSYSITFSLKDKDSSSWTTGGTDDIVAPWSVARLEVPVSTIAAGDYTYDGTLFQPSVSTYPSSYIVTQSPASIGGTNAGTYTASFTLVDPASSYWVDGDANATKTYTWEVKRATITTSPSQDGILTFDGTKQTPKWKDWSDSMLSIGGTYKDQVAAGTYSATFTPTSNYQWADGGTVARSVDWTIEKNMAVILPDPDRTYTFSNRKWYSAPFTYSRDLMSMHGITGEMDAGTFEAEFRLKDPESCTWSDGTTEPKTRSWTIQPDTIKLKPEQSVSLTYNGTWQQPSWSNYDPSKLMLGGVTRAMSSGTYVAAFMPTANYAWENGTRDPVEVAWTIGKMTGIEAPSQVGSLAYTGKPMGPQWTEYDENVIEKVESQAMEAGGYQTAFCLKDPTSASWVGGSSSPKVVSWIIAARTRSGKTLADLNVGDLVKDPDTTCNGEAIQWRVIGKDQDGENTVTLMSDKILAHRAFDAREPNNANTYRQSYGNSRYLHSNLLQWLNSGGGAGNWFSKMHSADQSPVGSTSSKPLVLSNWNPYANEPGFLKGFSDDLDKILLTAKRPSVTDPADGGGEDSVSARVFLLSAANLGQSSASAADGEVVYEYFQSAESIADARKKVPTQGAIDANESSYEGDDRNRYWTSTPSGPATLYLVSYDGLVLYSGKYSEAYNGGIGVAPAIALPSDAEIYDETDANGSYSLAF